MAKQEEEIILKTKAEGTQETVKDLNKVEKATDDVKKATEEYEDTLGDLAKETEFFGISINKIQLAVEWQQLLIMRYTIYLHNFRLWDLLAKVVRPWSDWPVWLLWPWYYGLYLHYYTR